MPRLSFIMTAIVTYLFLGTLSSYANDSSAMLGAGGLVLVSNDDIAMESEDLYISSKEIRVSYVFINKSDRDVTALVAFPLPEVDTQMAGESDIGVTGKDGKNFVDFRLLVNGAPVKALAEYKAMVNKRDVTPELKKAGISPSPFDSFLYDVIRALPEADKQMLAKAGAINGEEFIPLWTYKATFYWKQVFPAGQPVKVTHSYKPVVGSDPNVTDILVKHPGNEWANGLVKTYCIDRPIMGGLKKKVARKEILIAHSIQYILTTANNWRGPIGHFRLTVDKGSPRSLVSFCGEGVKKTGPTTFVMEKRNYMPRKELEVIIFAKYDN